MFGGARRSRRSGNWGAFQLALGLAAFACPGHAAACAYNVVTPIYANPPANLTDPKQIEQWRKDQEEIYDAYRMVERERDWRQYKERLLSEARQAPELSKQRFAEDIAVDLVPPLLPQFSYSDDCGHLYGPELLDPAGYLPIGTAAANAQLVELGILESTDEPEGLPSRFVRNLPAAWPSCTREARVHVQQRLEERFTHAELAHVWSALHRLDFDYNSVERASGATGELGSYRVLSFVSGRSGPLQFSDRAEPIGFTDGFSWVISRGQREDTAELRRFLSEDPVAVRLVDEIESTLSGIGTERCPHTQTEIAQVAAEVRKQIEERRRPRQNPR
jgi:hypothetical protein